MSRDADVFGFQVGVDDAAALVKVEESAEDVKTYSAHQHGGQAAKAVSLNEAQKVRP